MTAIDLGRVKLVIWDLDDTFWTGVLTEGGIKYQSRFHDAVINLTTYGIINSLCSNNDFDTAKRVLSDHHIWDYFVFPEISWSPKPLLIKSIIENAQLTAECTLFLEDNPRIRDEVHGAIPGLPPPLTRDAFYAIYSGTFSPHKPAPMPGAGLARLAHYKILERRRLARERQFQHSGQRSDVDFLRSCKITCFLIRDTLPLKGRLHELLKRTNQLNFSKWEITGDQLTTLLCDPSVDCRAIQVVDRFGDYEVCGFFALDRSRHELRHFLFSCRVLHMGIEAAVFAHLGCPRILASETAAPSHRLTAATAPSIDWVRIETAERPRNFAPVQRRSASAARIHLTGGCDFEPLASVLSSLLGDANVGTQLLARNDAGVSINVYGASSLIRLSADPDLVVEYRDILTRIPWLDSSCFRSPLFSGAFDVCFLSTQRDFMLANYRHCSGRFSIPAEYFEGVRRADLTQPSNWPLMLEAVRRRNGPVTSDFPPFFAAQFTFAGPITPAEYQNYLRWVSDKLPRRTTLVLINTAEVTQGPDDVNSVDWFSLEDVRAQWENQCLMNRALDEVIGHLPNIRLLDVRRFIRSPDAVHDLTHWTRQTHFEFSRRVFSMLKDLGVLDLDWRADSDMSSSRAR